MKRYPTLVASVFSAILAISLTACSSSNSPSADASQAPAESGDHACAQGNGSSGECATTPQEDPDRVPVEIAAGWKNFELNRTNRSDTKVDDFGHFVSSWNMCTRVEQVGVIREVAVWNALVKGINQALTLAPLPRDNMKCMPAPKLVRGPQNWDIGMDGDLVVTLVNNEKRILFETKYSDEVCTTIPDENLAKALLQTLNTAAASIAVEGCPISREPSPNH